MRSNSARDITSTAKWIASEALSARRSLSLSSLIKRSHSADMLGSTRPSLTNFLQLAQKGRFHDLALLLKSNDDKTIAAWLEHEKCTESSLTSDGCGIDGEQHRENILHQLLFQHPPVEVVDLLCKALTRIQGISVPEDLFNEEGLTPLHVAAAHGCDTAVIQRLLEGSTCKLPALTLDGNGRTALHWACALQPPVHSANLFASSKQTKLFESNKLSLIKVLADAYPQAKAIRDNNNQTPRDIAYQSHQDQSIILVVTPSVRQLEICTGMLLQVSRELEIGTCDVQFGYEIESMLHSSCHFSELDDDLWEDVSVFNDSIDDKKIIVNTDSPRCSMCPY